MKRLEQELVDSKVKIENLTCTKSAVDNRIVSVSLKPKKKQAWVLVSGGESKKEGVRGFGTCTWAYQ